METVNTLANVSVVEQLLKGTGWSKVGLQVFFRKMMQQWTHEHKDKCYVSGTQDCTLTSAPPCIGEGPSGNVRRNRDEKMV